jgi:hypothetical protein
LRPRIWGLRHAHRRGAGRRLVDRFLARRPEAAHQLEITPARTATRTEFDSGIIDAEDPAVRGNTDVVLINVAYFDEARLTGKANGLYIERVADPGGAASPRRSTGLRTRRTRRRRSPKEFAIGFAKQIGDVGALVGAHARCSSRSCSRPAMPWRSRSASASRSWRFSRRRLLRRQGHRPCSPRPCS